MNIIEPQQRVTPMLVFIGALIVDGAHVYSTLFVTYFDSNIKSKIKLHLILAPLLTILICYLLYIYEFKALLLSLVGSFALFHFIRQEAGWMKLAGRLDPKQPQILNKVDLFTSYIFTITPVLYLISERNRGFWLSRGDLPIIPNLYWDTGKYIMLFTGLVWLGFNIRHWRKTKLINGSKLLIILSNLAAWFFALTYLAGSWLGLLLIILPHGVPYFFLVAKEHNKKSPNKLTIYPFLYLLCVLLYFFETRVGGLKNPILTSIAIMPQIVHYYLDGIIWKRSIQSR